MFSFNFLFFSANQVSKTIIHKPTKKREYILKYGYFVFFVNLFYFADKFSEFKEIGS